MGNRRSPRRLRLGFACLLATAFAEAGCQRPLVQQVDPLPVTPNARKERSDTAVVPVTLPYPEAVADRLPRDTVVPARVAPPPAPATPTPILNAIAARATDKGKVSLASLGISELGPPAPVEAPKKELSAPVEAPKDSGSPATVLPESPPAEPPAVVAVPASEAPPIAGPETKIVIAPATRKEPEKKPEPAKLWRDGLEQLRNVARDQAGKNDDEAAEWSLRFALLDWLSHDGAKPGDARWRTVLAPLIHSADGSLADETALAAELHSAVAVLEEYAPLEITAIQLCRKVNGFGSYVPIDSSGCKAGRSLIVYCEMAGVRYEQEGELFHSKLSSRAELRVVGGGSPIWTHEQDVAHDSCRRRRRDYYVNYRLDLPQDLPPGSYELLLTQTDLTTNQSASRTAPVTIVR